MNVRLVVAGVAGLLGSAGIAAFQTPKPAESKPYFEYRIVRKDASGSGYSRVGSQYSSVGAEATWTQPDEAAMNLMGAQGWELVSSYLEMETAFPNFARGDTVEGLKPNVRPQAVVFVFKRAISGTEAATRKAAVSRLMEAELLAEKTKAEAAKLLKAQQDAKQAQDLKATQALWEQHKKEAVLDGVVPKAEDDTTLAILAVGPDSRLESGGFLLGIQTDLDKDDYISVSSWRQIRELTSGSVGKQVRVHWRTSSGATYQMTVTIRANGS